MRRLILFIGLFGFTLFGAKLSTEPSNHLSMSGKIFKDKCALVAINTKLIGTKDDKNGSDEVVFTIYNDGEIIKKASVFVPVHEAKDINLTILLPHFNDQKSPGIAIECEELGIYIDPFYLKKSDKNCTEYLKEEKAKKELQIICPTVQLFGFKCD